MSFWSRLRPTRLLQSRALSWLARIWPGATQPDCAQREAAHQAEQRRIALVAQRVADAVVLTDMRRRITWVNAGFERLTGYLLAEVQGRHPGELLQCAATDPYTVLKIRAALGAMKPVSCEILNRCKDGREYWIELKIQPLLDEQGRPEGFLALQLDVTKRRAAEVAL